MNEKNKIIYEVELKYKKYLKTVCKKVLLFYRGLPLTWEDLYNNFLYEVPELIKEYKHESGISKLVFIGTKCKHSAYNYCRTYSTNKHRILNESLSIDWLNTSSLNDFEIPKKSIDISIFNDLELFVYEKHFLDGMKLIDIHRKFNFSYYKVRAIKEKIKYKILNYYKNDKK